MDQGINLVTKVKSQVTDRLTAMFGEAQNAAASFSEQATQTIAQPIHQTKATLTETAASARTSLDGMIGGTMQRGGRMGNAFGEGMQNVVLGSFQDWLTTHPMLAWLITHPLYALVIGLLLLVLLWGLIGAIANLVQQAWVALLHAPLRLIHWVWCSIISLFTVATLPKSAPEPDKNQRLADLLNQLEAIRLQQDQLLEEVKAILALEASKQP
ncbi:hypothetical protein H6F95_23545 [Cyanobacteria bacterium FACHB-471]|nr:hypothetical protein [Cyanobacteria bacterium FACHB-471]